MVNRSLLLDQTELKGESHFIFSQSTEYECNNPRKKPFHEYVKYIFGYLI
jgi:hypothetical protein